jgi:UDP-3-O-acyl-N-acetylglucosamine deacetylase
LSRKKAHKTQEQRQKTIRKPVERTGVGVNLGLDVTVRLVPAPPDAGVVFVRTDLRELPIADCRLPISEIANGKSEMGNRKWEIPATPEYVAPEPRRTVLRRGEAEVQMTEHLLASIAGLEIDNLTVELSGPELPVGDGSALFFTEMIQEARVVEQKAERRRLTLRQPITVPSVECRVSEEDGPHPTPDTRHPTPSASIEALPADEGLTLSYTLEYADASLPRQQFELRVTPEAFVAELAPARTFIFEREAAALIARGFGRGANPENTLVARPDGSIIGNELRFPDEFARHKVLDLLGDLRLVGGGLAARIAAVRSGHAHNLRLIQALSAQRSAVSRETKTQEAEKLKAQTCQTVIPPPASTPRPSLPMASSSGHTSPLTST